MKKIVLFISMLCCLFAIGGCGKPVDKDFLKDFDKGKLLPKNEKQAKEIIPLLKKYKNGRFNDEGLKEVATKFCESTLLIIDDSNAKSKERADAVIYKYLTSNRIRTVYIDREEPVKVRYTKNRDVIDRRIDKMFNNQDVTIDTGYTIHKITGIVNTTGASLEEFNIKFDLKKDGEWVDSVEEKTFYINNGLPFEIIFKSDEDFDSIEITDYDYKLLPEKFAKY